MRFLYLSLAAIGLTASSVPFQQAVEAPRPLVVFVHGRGHLEADSATLRRVWKRDLDSALTIVGVPKLANDDVRLAWYADVLDPDFDSPCVIPGTEADSLGIETFARDFIGSLVSALPRDDSREVRALIGDLLYAVDESRRCAAARRVGNVIEAAAATHRPVVIVAYSLGSLVTYAYLISRAPTARRFRDLRLITIGSPLGNREVRELLGQGGDSLRVPPDVRGWENVYDPDDAFAAPLEGTVSPGAVQDRVTRTTSRGDAHHIGRYLRDRATGLSVARALCASSKPALDEACSRL